MSNDIKEFINIAKGINQVNTIPSNISLISNKYDKLFSLMKQYISKVLICIESTLYKIFKKSNMLINLQYSTCNRFINTLLSNHFNLTYHMIHMDKYNCEYFETMSSIINESKNQILHRIIYIIVDFYNAIDRNQLNIKSFELYIDDYCKQYDKIFEAMKHTIYAGYSKKQDISIPQYVKNYNPFHIKLDITDDILNPEEDE
jgi:hypothetical protein